MEARHILVVVQRLTGLLLGSDSAVSGPRLARFATAVSVDAFEARIVGTKRTDNADVPVNFLGFPTVNIAGSEQGEPSPAMHDNAEMMVLKRRHSFLLQLLHSAQQSGACHGGKAMGLRDPE